MRVCLLVENFPLAYMVLPAIRDMHPDLEETAFACAVVSPYLHLNSTFMYPRGLRWRDYPFTGAPAYAPFSTFEGHVVSPVRRTGLGMGLERAEGEVGLAAVESRLRGAEIVYAAIDPGPSSWLALDRALEHLSPGPGTKVLVPHLDSLDPRRLREAFVTPHVTDDDHYVAQVRQARIGRRFDYAYQVNALAVMGRTLADCGADCNAPVPSKYGLQILYALRSAGAHAEGALMNLMENWRGSGRYLAGPDGSKPRGIGSIASRSRIIVALRAAGLVEQDERRVAMSRMGEQFLERVHPDCEDPDLPFRLREWGILPEPEANQRIDRYLKTFFGKQIRFLAGGLRKFAPKAHLIFGSV